MQYRLAWLIATSLTVAAVGCADAHADAMQGIRGVTLQPVRAKPQFTLEDTHGHPFHFAADTRGTVTLLYFGYTNCPDVCPVHLTNIENALRGMSAADQARVRVVFVTTDPARDTAQRLRSWLDNFDPRFIGLRGPIDEVNRIEASLGMPPAVVEPMDQMKGPHVPTYGVGHAAQVLAFTPDDSLRVEYPSGITEPDWANDLPRLLKVARR
jgi:protein SCO1/2